MSETSLQNAYDRIEELELKLESANERIKRLEEELMDVKNKHSVLVADVALYEDRADRIHRLEDRINRASIAFFEDGSDARVARWMMDILEEERSKP
jgi:chromosome segregation ATPase